MTAPANGAGQPLLSLRGLNIRFILRGKGLFARATGVLPVLRNINLDIRPNEVLGLVGESGSGKTTLGRCIVGIYRPDTGEVLYTCADGTQTDLARLTGADLQRYQREIRMVFQDPFSSLNPRMTILQIVGDPLLVNRIASGSELEDRVASMIRRVGLSPGMLRRYPHAFSGGERQRIAIARALIMQPRVVIADEAVSALDVSIRAQILELLRELKEELSLTYLFISHDLSVVESMCDRVAVMFKGEIVELAEKDRLYKSPQHEYTRSLLSAVPIPDPRFRSIRK